MVDEKWGEKSGPLGGWSITRVTDLGGEPGEEFSPGAETNMALAQFRQCYHVINHITPEWSGCDSQHILI
jgi:hypothetical protein